MASARLRKWAGVSRDNAQLNTQAFAMHPERRGNASDLIYLILDRRHMQHRAPRRIDLRHRRCNDRIDIAGTYAIPLKRDLARVTGRLRTPARNIYIDFGYCLLRHALGRINAEADGPLRFIHIDDRPIAHAARNLVSKAQNFQGLLLGRSRHLVFDRQGLADQAGNL